MLKVLVSNDIKNQIKNIIEHNSFFKDFRLAEVDEGFELTGMKYCTISSTFNCGTFTLIGEKDCALKDVVADAFKDYPQVDIKGSLLLGDDNYRHFYWISSDMGQDSATVDFAIDIDEFRSVVNENSMGSALSSAWYHYLYGTDYGMEYVFFKDIDDFKASINMAISNFDIDEDDKKLGLNMMDIYKFISEIMDTSACNIDDLKKVCSDLKKKYHKDNTEPSEVDDIVENNLVPMASAIEGLTIYEVWANAVKKLLSKSKFFKLFQIEEELEDLENEDYIELLARIAEEYEGLSEIECEDFIDICDEYGLTSEIDEDDFEEVKEKLEDMEIPDFEEE